jgi:CIC family chloride channel protein
MGPTVESMLNPQHPGSVDGRVNFTPLIAVAIGLAAAIVAQILLRLVDPITKLSFYGRLTPQFVWRAGDQLGLLVIIVVITSGVIVGLMVRDGSQGICWFGFPEVMEQDFRNQSRIKPRLTFLCTCRSPSPSGV